VVSVTGSPRRRQILFVLVGAVVAILAIAFLARRGAGFKLTTAPVQRGSIEATVSATGTVNPVTSVQIGSQVSGTVSHIYADYNSLVKKDQLLLQLDPAIYQAQLAQARANQERSRAEVENTKRSYERARDLLAQHFTSKADRDAALTAYQSAVAAEKQTRAAVQLASVNLAHCSIFSPISGTVIARSVDVGQTVAASLQAPQPFLI